MSLIAPPNQNQSLPPPRPAPPLTLKARLKDEHRHWDDMPTPRLCLLLLPLIPLFVLDPLLPIAAYALQLWASSSWAWRDRWASIWALARQGGVFVALVLLYAALSSAHIWIFPDLTASAQAFWLAHLPGDLSLSPLDGLSLVARTLLLLPLAPALALYYERVDPRTRVQPQRILTPADLVPKTRASTTASSPANEAPPTSVKAPPAPKAATPRQPKQRSKNPPPHQTTIEGFLASNDKASTRQQPSSPPAKKKPAPPPSPTETDPPVPTTRIDWDDVAE